MEISDGFFFPIHNNVCKSSGLMSEGKVNGILDMKYMAIFNSAYSVL